MPGRDEIFQSLTGAWRLFLDRPDAMRYFDVSVDGFWRSFAAIIFVAPVYALFASLEHIEILRQPVIDPAFSETAFAINKVLTLVLDWITLPILLALFAGQLGVGRTYAAYIVARNWCVVLATAPFGLIALLLLLGGLTTGLATFLLLIISAVVLYYNYLIARRALAAGIGLAVGVVIAELVISFLVVGFADAVSGYHSAGL